MVKANKLTQLQASRIKEAGMHGDGAGLWLKVTDGGSKSWVLRYTMAGRERRTGLGPYPDVSLAEARDKAMAWRKQVREGVDPMKVKQKAMATARAEQANKVTFAWCAAQYIESHRAGWKNAKHAEQWVSTLAMYAEPVMGKMDVALVETEHVVRVLEPIWNSKPETASRLRGRIESILGWASARRLRNGDNPARWKGHLDSLFPARTKVSRTRHFAALPWKDMQPFMTSLEAQAGVGALALRFTILTAARSGEVRGMVWDEVDLSARLWVVPAERMKAGREHRIPLSDAAVALLRQQEQALLAGTNVVFPSVRDHKPLSDMTLTAVLRRMQRNDLTVHGFRSTFRDWAAEATDYPQEMAEMALAHVVSNKVEAAYRRGDMLEKRREMMQKWAEFIL
ncbi:tyrosine-type recombinase/integrase [Comamonas kerstersii]|uniref:tyrosine-type recombinase/integrase n=1 Tax=Comamonas kerstersii TaxID=225992 RepID=UPI001B338BD3|nr:site-specific integrase [Comamonas kerstersii]QTW19955.1 integrase arm-type DNA-binding domain-containing protein [Comamonas kerstersii]